MRQKGAPSPFKVRIPYEYTHNWYPNKVNSITTHRIAKAAASTTTMFQLEAVHRARRTHDRHAVRLTTRCNNRNISMSTAQPSAAKSLADVTSLSHELLGNCSTRDRGKWQSTPKHRQTLASFRRTSGLWIGNMEQSAWTVMEAPFPAMRRKSGRTGLRLQDPCPLAATLDGGPGTACGCRHSQSTDWQACEPRAIPFGISNPAPTGSSSPSRTLEASVGY